MFENLRDAFKEAVANFKEEIRREDVPETVDALLRGMKSEVADKKAYISRLEAEIEQTLQKAKQQKSHAETALRRQKMATDIGDAETARVAGEYAEKHAHALTILEHKAKALTDELKLRRTEAAEMMTQLKSAIADREKLVAQAGRTQTRRALGEADDLFAEMDRMAEKIEGTDHQARAAEELSEEFDLGSTRTDPNLDAEFEQLEREPELTVEEKLEELKRRMGRSD